jgi:hypothetical protein
VNVAASVSVSFPGGSSSTTADITLNVSDSSQGTTNASTPVTIEPETADAGNFSDYVDNNNVVTSDGLLDAAADFRGGNLTGQELLDAAASFRNEEPVV